MVLALSPQPPVVDFGLFIRPFQREAWVLVVTATAIIIAIIFIPYLSINDYESTGGHAITLKTSGFFFILINAYYGGAMTMFFSSELTVPFNTTEEVMRYIKRSINSGCFKVQ